MFSPSDVGKSEYDGIAALAINSIEQVEEVPHCF